MRRIPLSGEHTTVRWAHHCQVSTPLSGEQTTVRWAHRRRFWVRRSALHVFHCSKSLQSNFSWSTCVTSFSPAWPKLNIRINQNTEYSCQQRVKFESRCTEDPFLQRVCPAEVSPENKTEEDVLSSRPVGPEVPPSHSGACSGTILRRSWSQLVTVQDRITKHYGDSSWSPSDLK